MLPPKEVFKLLLKDAGQSVTTARLQIFEALLGQEPMTMHELTEQASDVDRASVYRTITLFEKLSIVQRLNSGWKYKIELTDKFSDHHHHLTCLNCGRTIAMNESELERVIDNLAKSHNFSPTAHQIEIQGYCSNCRITS